MNIRYKLTLVISLLIFSVKDARADALNGLSALTETFYPMLLWFVISVSFTIIFSQLWRSRKRKIYSYLTYAGLISLVILFSRIAIGFLYKNNSDFHPNQTLLNKIKVVNVFENENIGVVIFFLLLSALTIVVIIQTFKKMK